LFRHTKRDKWGLAILALDGNGRRSYQFQDGKLRTFKLGYYELLEVVQDLPIGAEQLVKDLHRALDISKARKEAAASGSGSRANAMTMDDQIELFRFEFPGGFSDPKWDSSTRGADAPRRLKRHRAPAILMAQERLDEAILDAMINDGQHEEVRQATMAVLRSTDLVRPADDLKPIIELPDELVRNFAVAVKELLYGTGPYETRFDAFASLLQNASSADVTWPLATTLSTLVRPNEHVHIRPSSIKRQAQWSRPKMIMPARPTGLAYLQLLDMAEEVRVSLQQAEIAPADLVDVYDFIRLTLRPKAATLLKEHRFGGDDTAAEGTEGGDNAEAKADPKKAEAKADSKKAEAKAKPKKAAAKAKPKKAAAKTKSKAKAKK